MNARSDAFGFRTAAAVATFVGAFAWFAPSPAPTEARPAPLFDPASAGPRPAPVPADARVAADRLAETEALLFPRLPAWATFVAIHPLADAADPPADAPYHAVVGAGGALRPTPRGVAGERAAPPGAPEASTVDGFHVAVPAALAADPTRDARVRDLWRAAVRRFGRADGARFVFELRGADGEPPPGFDPARWTPEALPAEERR